MLVIQSLKFDTHEPVRTNFMFLQSPNLVNIHEFANLEKKHNHILQIIANDCYLKDLLFVIEFSFLVCPSGHRRSLRQQELDRSFTTFRKTHTTTRFDFKSFELSFL